MINAVLETPTFNQPKNSIHNWKADGIGFTDDEVKGVGDLVKGKVERLLRRKNQATAPANVTIRSKHVHADKLSRGSCTAVITEGDSAFNLAVNGIPEQMRDTHGVFALQGPQRTSLMAAMPRTTS